MVLASNHWVAPPRHNHWVAPSSPSGGMFVGGEAEEGRAEIRILDEDDHPASVQFNPAPWSEAVHGGFLGDFRFQPPGSGTKTATWTFSDLAPGVYRVSATCEGRRASTAFRNHKHLTTATNGMRDVIV